MDHTEAHKIISALADGCDPLTGEKVENSVLQHGNVIRALHVAIRALERGPKPPSSRRKPTNAGKEWTEPEERQLLQKFEEGKSIAELAQALDRTHAGIHARLVLHGRLQATGPQLRGRGANAKAGAIGVLARSET
jgi:DNA-binding NarL/FixJ family response regulator